MVEVVLGILWLFGGRLCWGVRWGGRGRSKGLLARCNFDMWLAEGLSR